MHVSQRTLLGGISSMLRRFRIYNKKYREYLGILFYDTELSEFKVEMLDSYEGLHPCPFMDILGCMQHKKWIDGHNAENYISQRMFPSNRHALSEHLKNLGLTEYSQIGILEKTQGECDMDSNFFWSLSQQQVILPAKE